MTAPYAVSTPSRLRRPRRAIGGAVATAVVLLGGGCAIPSTQNTGSNVTSTRTAITSAPASQPSASATSDSTASVPSVASMPVGPFGTAADLAVLDGITVVGGSATALPGVSFSTKPVTVTATARKLLSDGSGDISVVGSRVKANLLLIKGSDGSTMDSTYDKGAPQTLDLDPTQTIPGLVQGLTGVQAGSRVLIVIPPKDAYGTAGRPELGVSGTENLVLVADIINVQVTPPKPLTQAQGTVVAPVAGLPTVTFDPTAGPTITIPAGVAAPAKTVSQNLIDGAGDVVANGQTVTVHYTGVLWKDGSVFDSSWTRGQSFDFAIGGGQVIKAWDSGLVGKKVGSRVLLVVPPADGYGTNGSPPKISGTDTLVFVVDILAAN